MKTFLPLLIITTLSITACSTQHRSTASGWNYQQPANGGIEQVSQAIKVIYTARVDLQVREPDSAITQIGQLASKYEGYVNQTGNDRAIIRVRSRHLKSAMTDIEELGKVTDRQFNGKDVSDEYRDHAIRLDNAEKARKRYLQLLEQAENVEAALLVEKELERLNESIDVLKGKMNRIDHLSDFSTITVNVREQPKPGILGYVGIGIYSAVKWLFVRN